MDDFPPNFQNRDAQAESMARYLYDKIAEKRCVMCEGEGHYAFECPTKKIIDRQAKLLEISCEWGATKSKLMLDAYEEKHEAYAELMKR